MKKAEKELSLEGVTRSHVGQQSKKKNRKSGGVNSTNDKDGSNATKRACSDQGFKNMGVVAVNS